MKVKSVTNSSINLNIFWDGGSTISLITFATAKQPNLKGEETNLSIIMIGGIKENIASYLYELLLKDKYGETVIIQTYDIDKISTDFKPMQLSGVMRLFKVIDETKI